MADLTLATISEVTLKVTEHTRNVSVKLHPKIDALFRLADLQKLSDQSEEDKQIPYQTVDFSNVDLDSFGDEQVEEQEQAEIDAEEAATLD